MYCHSWYINFFIVATWYHDFHTIRKIPCTYKLHASLFVHDILAYIIPRQGCKISRTFRFTRSRCLSPSKPEKIRNLSTKCGLASASSILLYYFSSYPFIIKSSPQSSLPFFSSSAHAYFFHFTLLPSSPKIFSSPFQNLNGSSFDQFRSGESRIFEIEWIQFRVG